MSTLYRVQYEDDNLNPANNTLIQQGDAYFISVRKDPAYNNTILSIDLPPYGYTEEQLNNMLSLLKPDMILFNRYPWELSTTYNPVQLLYGWYGMLIYNRNIALKGNDGTGKTPIPFGAYTQTWFAYRPVPPTASQMKLNHFGSLAFGAKMISTFVYNDYTYPSYNIKSILFDTLGVPTVQFYQQAEINRQISNLGPALVRLQTSDIRFIPTSLKSWPVGGTEISPLKWVEIDKPRPDAFLTAVKATRQGFADNQNGDVLVGYFKPVHKSLDGTNTTNENYFMIVNALYDSDSVSTFQNIRLHFNFGELTNINSLLRISRLTGIIEVVPLVKENTIGNEYYFDLLINGGEGDLFKYNNGVPFVGFPRLTSLNENNLLDKDVLLYPNPVNDILNIKLSENNNRFMLYDIVGNIVFDQQIPASYNLNMNDFKSGIYFVKTETSQRILNAKLIKK